MIKSYFGALSTIPLLPILYFQGKRIRDNFPSLPEAIEPQGIVGNFTKQPLRVLLLGESTLAGVGVERHAEGFTGALTEKLAKHLKRNIKWRVYARSGYTANRMIYKIIPIIEEEQADLIVIGLGGNDAFHLNRPHQWRRSIHTLIEKLQLKFGQTPIVFMNMPPIKEFPAFTPVIHFTVGNLVEVLGFTLKDTIKRYNNVHFNQEIIRLDEWLVKLNLESYNRSDFFSDGVHPSKLTYQIWGKDMADYILNHVPLKL